MEGKSEGILCRPTFPHLQIRISHCTEECHREEDVHSTDSILRSLRQIIQVMLCEAELSFTNCITSSYVSFCKFFENSNFYRL
jgi:hypothetical protein